MDALQLKAAKLLNHTSYCFAHALATGVGVKGLPGCGVGLSPVSPSL